MPPAFPSAILYPQRAMYRALPATFPPNSRRSQNICTRLFTPLSLWIFVSLAIKYGYFSDSSLVLGPNSSRLLKASSIFVDKIQVRDDAKKGLILFGFSEKPELSLESKWNVSKYLPVGTYTRRGFSLWLNKGSKILIRWTADTSSFNYLSVTLVKGERSFVTLKPSTPTDSLDSSVTGNAKDGKGQAQYLIVEDDSYYIGVTNMNPRNILVSLDLELVTTMYDTSKASSKCSTINGLCQLKLLFPRSQFLVLETPNTGDLEGWFIQLSFMARLFTYAAILGNKLTTLDNMRSSFVHGLTFLMCVAFVVLVIFLILKYLGTFDGERSDSQEQASVNATEADPLMPQKTMPFTYGTSEEDEELGTCGTSEDLYDGRICVICYDQERNCFFIPCGHCATCHQCAERIMDGENKVCPVCRRFIHKVRKLFNA